MDCFVILCVYVHLPVCGFMNISSGAYKGQKIVSAPVVLRLQAVVSCPTVMLETEFWSSAGAVHCAIAPAQCITHDIS